MALRRISGLCLLGLGGWLFSAAVQAVMAYTSRGGDLAGYLFEPPTGIIRMTATGLIMLGGLLVVLNGRGGGIMALTGALLYALLGLLMAQQGAELSLWQDEILYALPCLGLSGLALSVRRH